MQSMSGISHVPSAPLQGTTVVTGNGVSVTVDGASDSSWIMAPLCNAPVASPWPNPHTVTGQRLKVFQQGNLLFEDPNAVFVVTRAARPDLGVYPNGDPFIVPTLVEASGQGWSATMTDIRWNAEHDKLIMDFSLTAQEGLIVQGGEGGEGEPGIVRH